MNLWLSLADGDTNRIRLHTISPDRQGPENAVHASARADGDDLALRFSQFMVASLLLPVALFVATPPLFDVHVSGDTFTLLFGISVAHGGLSGLFWIDRRYRRYVQEDRRRSYGVPFAIACAALLGVALFGRPFTLAFTALYFGWTAVHFARQNWGVLCLSASGLKAGAPSRLEYHGCNLAGVGGALAVVAPFAKALEVPVHHWVLVSTLGLVLVIAAFALAVVAAVRQWRAGAPTLQIGLTLSIGVFFLPLFLLPAGIGFTCVGMAHAMQYSMIMYRLAADRAQGSPALRVAGSVAVAVVYVAAFFLCIDASLWGEWSDVAEVLLYCVVMWHFLLDARMFRLRQATPRNIMRESLPFLFPARAKVVSQVSA